MSDTTTIGLPEAARSLGINLRALRQAIRAGRIPGPTRVTATAGFTVDWLNGAEKAMQAEPFRGTKAPRVPAFARYEGTSAWRKYKDRVRAFAAFKAGK